jgi:hypothetical protein
VNASEVKNEKYVFLNEKDIFNQVLECLQPFIISQAQVTQTFLEFFKHIDWIIIAVIIIIII